MPARIREGRRKGRDRSGYDAPMLAPPFRWRISEADAFLDHGYINVANVQPYRGGQLTLTIRWQGKTVGGQVGSIAQGVRYAERWLLARPGPPRLIAGRRR